MAEYKREWYLRNTEHQKARVRENSERSIRDNQSRAWAYLGSHQCVDCGESDPVVLQFDHIRDKLRNVSQMLRQGFNWSAIEAEIAKCEVRCANCHRRKTAREQGLYERKAAFGRLQLPSAD
jgi:5-methylcytosine-specific restriction endonuclease McrA